LRGGVSQELMINTYNALSGDMADAI